MGSDLKMMTGRKQ